MTLDTRLRPASPSVHLHTLRQKRRGFNLAFLVVITCVLAASLVLSVAVGSADISVAEAVRSLLSAPTDSRSTLVRSVITELRLPRTLLAALVGIALAVSGVAMQAVLRNPLVSPFTLGLSNAASFGAALALGLGFSLGAVSGQFSLLVFAFGFGMLTVFIVHGIARLKGGSKETYLLTGIAIGYLFSAGISGIKFVTDDEALREITLWTMGGLWGSSWEAVILLTPVATACVLLIYLKAGDLNVMAAGEDVAASLGVNVKRLRLSVLVVATLLASSVVAFTGVIGFVGLVAPHIARMILGGDARYLIPGAALLGACLVVIADIVGRTVVSPVEIPVGVIIAVVGVPFFLYLIIRQKREAWA